MGNEYLKTKELAEMLGVSRDSVRRWVREGRLPVLKGLRSHLLKRSDVDKLFKLDEIVSTKPFSAINKQAR